MTIKIINNADRINKKKNDYFLINWLYYLGATGKVVVM